MIKLIPVDPTTKVGHRSIVEMARQLLADDPQFVAEFDRRLASRQLVTSLAVVRVRAGLSRKELAEKMGCGQPKISKLESGCDADVRFGDVAAYLQACGYKAKIVMSRA